MKRRAKRDDGAIGKTCALLANVGLVKLTKVETDKICKE